MNAAELIAALELPVAARVDQRVPKRLVVEHGAITASDKRRINEGINEIQWLAALKPTTVGVPVFRDSLREYVEIAVLSAVLRAGVNVGRIAPLIHRSVPYPVVLVTTTESSVMISLVHKRWSQARATVLDGEMIAAPTEERNVFDQDFRAALSLSHQPRAHLQALYHGWMDTIVALLAARVTGVFTNSESSEHAAERREALREYTRLDAEVARLRRAAAKEKQMARQVGLNVERLRVEQQRDGARRRLWPNNATRTG